MITIATQRTPLVTQRLHNLIAITSTAQPTRAGYRTVRLGPVITAGVVSNNGTPSGDAPLSRFRGGAVCAVSSVTHAPQARQVVAGVVRRIEVVAQVPPLDLATNVPEGDAHNHTLEKRYTGNARRTA